MSVFSTRNLKTLLQYDLSHACMPILSLLWVSVGKDLIPFCCLYSGSSYTVYESTRVYDAVAAGVPLCPNFYGACPQKTVVSSSHAISCDCVASLSRLAASIYATGFLPARVFAIATCLDVCPSVCLSHTGIVPSRAKAG